MTHVCVYMIIRVCVNASEKTALPALRGRAINEEPVKTQCTGVMKFVGAGVGFVGAGVGASVGNCGPGGGVLGAGVGSGSQGPPFLEEALVGNRNFEVSGRRGLRRGQESGPGVCKALRWESVWPSGKERGPRAMRGTGVECSAQEAFPPVSCVCPRLVPSLQLKRSRKAWCSSSRTSSC